jgi:hypothetical protein
MRVDTTHSTSSPGAPDGRHCLPGSTRSESRRPEWGPRAPVGGYFAGTLEATAGTDFRYS